MMQGTFLHGTPWYTENPSKQCWVFGLWSWYWPMYVSGKGLPRVTNR